MSSESAFNKKLAPETTMDQVEGLLEHFNLPPKAIAFVRENKRKLQIGLIVVVLFVVGWSLYGSYRDKVLEESSSALSLALEATGQERLAKLQEVTGAYGGTDAGLWAEIEIGHLQMEEKNYPAAAATYEKLALEVAETNPLYPLLYFAIGQAHEANKDFSKASAAYEKLKEIDGFRQLGYIGLARLQEAQGDFATSIAILNNYLLEIGDDPLYANQKEEVKAKIGRLEARK